MGIRFGALYEDYIAIEEAIREMERDIDNVECNITKCKLENEIEELRIKLEEIEDAKFDFDKLHFPGIIQAIEDCISCIDFDRDRLGDLTPPPIATAGGCGDIGTELTLNDIRGFRISEISQVSTPVVEDEYEFSIAQLPYEFTTDVERYIVNWDRSRNGLSIKAFNLVGGEPVPSFEISHVVAILQTDTAYTYEVDAVQACEVYMVTNTPTQGLSRTIDSEPHTAPSSITDNGEIMAEAVFKFFV